MMNFQTLDNFPSSSSPPLMPQQPQSNAPHPPQPQEQVPHHTQQQPHQSEHHDHVRKTHLFLIFIFSACRVTKSQTVNICKRR